MKKLVFRFVKLIFGLFIMAVGMTLAFQSNLGLSPWDVLNDGVSKTIHITVGQASIGIGLIILCIDLLFREKVGFGTFINIVLVGSFFDLIQYLDLIPGYGQYLGYEHIVPRVAMCVASMALMSLAMYLYMSVELGAGPRDSLMCMLTKRTKLSVGGVRVIIEGVAFAAGWLLGGNIGLGSVVLVLLSGPIMQGVFRLFRFDVTALNNESIADTVRSLRPRRTNGEES